MGKRNDNKISYRLPRIKTNINLRFLMFGGFLVLSIFLKAFFKTTFPTLMIIIIFFIFFYTFLIWIVFNKFREKLPRLIIDFYFLNICLDIILLTAIIYFLGGITWIGPFLYSLIIIDIFWLFPKNKAIFLIGLCFFSLVFLIGLQYLDVLPDFYIFFPEERSMQNFYYALVTTIGSLFIIFFLSYSSDVFRRTLEIQIANLKIIREKLNKTKKNLEFEVRKRTEDLEKEKKHLEDEAVKKTEELEVRKRIVQARVKELERFHKIAVDRELEMIKLKEEITNLKNRIKK